MTSAVKLMLGRREKILQANMNPQTAVQRQLSVCNALNSVAAAQTANRAVR